MTDVSQPSEAEVEAAVKAMEGEMAAHDPMFPGYSVLARAALTAAAQVRANDVREQIRSEYRAAEPDYGPSVLGIKRGEE